MQEFTVYVSGRDDPDSFNRMIYSYKNIIAENFIDACEYVVGYYYNDDDHQHWGLKNIDGVPTLCHIRRPEWKYGMYADYEEAYLASFAEVETQKVTKYREMKGISDDTPVSLKCWERFIIPYVKEDGENINITYSCYKKKLQIPLYIPKEKSIDTDQFIYSPSVISIPLLEQCVNCDCCDK